METEAESYDQKEMSFLEHLGELRRRLIRALIYIGVAAVASGIFWEQIIRLLMKPGNLETLVFIGPLDAFMAKFKLSLYCGLVLAMPLVIFEILAFILPALTRKEKRITIPIIFLTAILFYAGVTVGYFFILPPGTKWLLSQGGDVMKEMLAADRYLSYAMMFLAGVGVSFETPVIIYILGKIGLVTPRSLLVNWRYAFMIIITVAAVLTPDWSPVTMGLFAAPMIILYFLSILLVRFL